LINSILNNNNTNNNLNENPAPVIAEKPKPPAKHYTFEKVSKYSEHFNIQDDDDGHLIYVPGDLLKQRCNLTLFFLETRDIFWFILVFKHLNKLDKIKRTLGEGTFGKVVEVKDSYE
jgi:hypothetical protein